MNVTDRNLLVVWALIISVLLSSLIASRATAPAAPSRFGYSAQWSDDRQLACMAANVYMEARSEPIKGQIAVAQVVMNRAKQNREKVCNVIMAKAQFSWTLSGKIRIKNEDAYKTALWVAKNVLDGKLYDHSQGADHYHADYVAPKWAKSKCMKHKVTIGRHIFFKCHYGRYRT